jgi:hypothetical protein
MAVETLHPIDDGQVVREVIPGGYEPRQLTLYPNHASARVVQWLSSKRIVPSFVVAMVDDGKSVDPDFLNRELADGEEIDHAA